MTSQWANFVRNHDELTLDKLSDDERQEVFDAFGPDPDMQLYGRGLRRRLPSMLGGDERRMRMAYSLTFSLPGTPVLFYGEEIGMAENLDIPGRFAVRTPMQWTGGANGGFSKAAKRRLTRPLPDGLLRPEARQRRRPAPRPRILLVVHAQPHLHVPAAAGDRLVDGRDPQAAQPRGAWPTCAGRNPVGRWSRCTTSARTAASCPSSSTDVPPGSILVDLLDGLSEHELDADGRVELDLDGLRLPMAAPAATGGRADHLSRRVHTSSRCSPVRRRGDRVPVLGRGSSDRDPAGTAGPVRCRPDFISVSVERWMDSLGVDGALGSLRLRSIGGHLPIPAFGVDGARRPEVQNRYIPRNPKRRIGSPSNSLPTL